MAGTFDWSVHVPKDMLAIPLLRHRQYGPKIVAANNELIHPIIESLFLQFSREFDPEQVRHYPNHRPVVERVARHLQLPAEQVLLTAGSDAAIQILMSTMGKTSGRLVLQWPNYYAYNTYARLHGIEVKNVPVIGLSWEAAQGRLADAMDASPPALVVVTNPSPIDGSWLPLDAVKWIAAKALRCGHLLIIDEAYIGFSDIDHIAVARDYPNIVLLRSFSKTMGLAGLRIGAVAFGHPDPARFVQQWSPSNPVSVIAALFLAYCLDHSAEIAEARSEIVSCREWIRQRAATLLSGWSVPPSAANFVYLGAPDKNSNATLVGAFESSGIAVRDISRMLESTDAVRVTIGHRPVSERIVSVLQKYPHDMAVGSCAAP